MAGPFRIDEDADDASFEASVRAHIYAIVDELTPQIVFPAPLTGRKPFEEPGASHLFFRIYLQNAFARGTPLYSHFALRSNGFFALLDESALDPTPFLDIIRDLGKRVIEVEALRQMRAELVPGSGAASVHDPAPALSGRIVEM